MESFRFAHSPAETSSMGTEELRSAYLAAELSVADSINWVYTHYDRVMIGVARPGGRTLKIETPEELKAEYFLERRELGIINVGGKGSVTADQQVYDLDKLDCVYLGRGTKDISFSSDDHAIFFLMSCPAHRSCPNEKRTSAEANQVRLGDQSTANKRTIYQYICAGRTESCQLVMGLTQLESGSVWNTMPAHTHTRRMEAYFYFDLAAEHRVFHFMGQPSETRHMLVGNHEAVISPPWSIHSGCGTSNYSFIWGMAGENTSFTDMDGIAITALR